MGTRTASLPAPAPNDGGPSGHDDRDAPRGVALRAGARLGDYRLLAPIGTGGMAYVWAATRTGDYGFTRLFAIKAMREEIALDPSFRRMFLEEAKLAARIHHTNVVEVLDLGEEVGTVYQVMPLIEGDSLAKLVKTQDEREPGARVPRSVAVRIVVDALRGLHAAHEMRGDDGAPLEIVHRDVSPHNVLVGIDGVAKIADFGVAKAMGTLGEESESGTLKGKVSYMSPEQLERGQRDVGEVDRRSDLFSVGVVLWELLAGTRLTPSAAATLLAAGTLRDLRVHDASIPEALSALTMRALARDPAARFASADAMADALEEAARGCGLALSTKEVASWTSPLATRTVTRRREDVAEAAGTLGLTLPVTVMDVTPIAGPKTRRRRRVVIGVGAVVVVMGMVVAGVAMRRGAGASSGTGGGASAEILAPATPSGAPYPQPFPLVWGGREQAAASAQSAVNNAGSAASAGVESGDAGARRGAVPGAKGKRGNDGTKPKFGNPYAR